MKMVKEYGVWIILLFVQIPALGQSWSLERCLQYAEQHNAELLVQAQSVQASSKNQQIARSHLFPEISGRADIDHYWRIPVMAFPAEIVGGEPGTFVTVRTSTPWTASYGADASFHLINPQAWQALRLSSLQLQMQESEFRSFKQLLRRNVKMAFYTVQTEYKNLNASRLLFDNYHETHRLIELQFQGGFIDQITFNQSLTLLNDRDEARSQAETALQAAYLDLKFWMGYPLYETLSIDMETPMPVNMLLEDAFNVSLLPDYNVARLRQAQAEQQWRISRARLWPTLAGIANYQRVAFRNSFDFLEGGDWYNVGAIGLRLNVPILSVRQMIYEPAQQRIWMKQATHEFKRYQEEQEKRYLNERLKLEQAYKVWKNQEQNILLASQNEGLANRKIEEGIIDMVQLKQIQDDLNNAQQRLNSARLNYLRHYVELQYLQQE